MSPKTLAGQVLGKYQVLEPIGQGGMAQVYRAYHPQLERFVAVKVLRSDLIDDPEFTARFAREARSVAALRHPNIVQVFDFDVQDELSFMVMELLPGDTLKALLNQYRRSGQTLPVADVVRILRDVLKGLAFAHQAGIIHRDIKPANILLTAQGEAVITDFGIAQIVGGTQYTVSGALMGTFHYMAPEQGLGQLVDGRSDLYSLGVVLYEMLTGHPPFEADTPLAILMKHVNDPLPLPHAPEQTIPEPFERVVLKALAKQPEERYQTAEAMQQALIEVGTACLGPTDWSAPISALPTGAGLPTDTPVVYSGTDRARITDRKLAADDTDLGFTNPVTASSGLSASAEAPASAPTPWQTGSTAQRVIQPALVGIGLIIGVNLLAVGIGTSTGWWGFHQFGWPVQLALVAIFLLGLMQALELIWLLIPAGLLLGNAALLALSSLTQNWDAWRFLWVFEPLLVLGLVILVVPWARTLPDQGRSLARRLGGRLVQVGAILVVLITMGSLFASFANRFFPR